MRLYHFVDKNHGLDDLRKQRLKIARIHQLNDPFEFLGVDLTEPFFRQALEKSKWDLSQSNGLLCFSHNWSNPVLWGHYADKHRGLCLGFDLPDGLPQEITYIANRMPQPKQVDEAFTRNLLFTKFDHWRYEEEYRVYVSLETDEGGLFFSEFGENLVLRQVIVGCESDTTRHELELALGDQSSKVSFIKARLDYRKFSMVRNHDHNAFG
ncbi:hypothetical protein GETHOR_17870 [Geothrix oryzae]|uniref:DUF2971 domain-containing protein n=1 Tax=Geothrix oryzae TaxID=2927975 RepID=A0ABM8DRN7_9BACT|nr:DUF2971 domain-containing protein [Geothrix oryzae]BDU69686.1 hypothetical protein GETHOR_17870 [Geothrix oryzae]